MEKTLDRHGVVEYNVDTLRGIDLQKQMQQKVCQYCKISKSKIEFPKHMLYRDRLDTRCRACINHHKRIQRKLKKEAPPRPGLCEICGKVPHKWVLDHDHKDDTFRGFLCDGCNTGLGKLGDNIQDVINALNYLLKVKNNKRFGGQS